MPPIDTSGPKKKRKVKRYGAVGRGADTTAPPKPKAKVKPKAGPPKPHTASPSGDMVDRSKDRRAAPAPRPVAKERMYASPNRPRNKRVINKIVRDEQKAREKRAETRRAVARMDARPTPSPDALDTYRSRPQKKRDAEVVAENIREARRKVLKDRPSFDLTDTLKAAAGKVYGPGSPNRSNVVTKKEAEELRAKGVKVRTVSVGASIPAQNTVLGQYRHLADPEERARSMAPALKVLEQTLRPVHGVASGSKAALKGENVPKAVGRGVTLKERTLFSDVLKEAGVKNKTVRTVAGLVLDVGLDPTTYVTGGTGSIARKAGETAAKKAGKKAVKAGLSKEQAARMEERARNQAERKASPSRGVVLKFAGREAPGVRQATARRKPRRVESALPPVPKPAPRRGAAPRPLRDPSAPAPAGPRPSSGSPLPLPVPKPAPRRAKRRRERVAENLRAAAADVNPNVRPVGVSREVSDEAIRATRTARAKSNRGLHEAQQQALGIKAIGEANYAKVIDAIEAGKIGSLPPELRPVAVKIRSQFRYANRQRKQAGIKGGEIGTRGPAKLGPVPTRTITETTRERPVSVRSVTDAERKAVARRLAKRYGLTTQQVLKLDGERLALVNKDVTTAADTRRIAEIDRQLPDMLPQSHAVRGREREVTRTRTVEGTKRGRATRTTIKGERRGKARGYVPHILTDDAREASGHVAGGVGRKVVSPSSSKARADERSLAELRAAEPGKYSDDLATIYATRRSEGSTAAARADLNRRLADLGTPVKRGSTLALGKNESVYHIVGSDISAPLKGDDLQRLVDSGKHEALKPMRGKYVVLNDDVVKRAIEGVKPTLQGPGLVRGFDKAQGGFKTVALFTPGYHVRNLVGDTMNAYLAQAGHKLPRNLAQSGRVLKAEGRRDKGLRKLDAGKAGKGTVKTGKYGRVSYDEVAEQLSRHGAMRSGFTARELPELAGQRATLRKVRTPKRVKSALLNREDLPRVSTAIDALKKGATWEEAAEAVNKFHFDYGHLTNFERNFARRAAPFYTFTARNVPLQAKSIIGKPGKYANFQKVREEAARHVGMDEESQKARELTDQLRAAGVKLPKGWESLMSEYEQRNAGVPVRWKGGTFTVSFGFPLSDLSELPGAAGKGQAEEWFKKAMSMASPLVKNPAEYFNNYSFFFRDQLERDNSPLVPAPKPLAKLPKSIRDDIGLTKIRDKRTGKMVWAWPGKADYIAKMVPGLPAFAVKMSAEGDNRRGQGKVAQALQFAGLRAEPFDPVREATNLAYARMAEIAKEKAKLNQQGITAENATPAYRKLLDQEKVLRGTAYLGKQRQGYKVLPKTGGPKKLKVKSGFDFDGGGKDFDFSGGGQKFDFG